MTICKGVFGNVLTVRLASLHEGVILPVVAVLAVNPVGAGVVLGMACLIVGLQAAPVEVVAVIPGVVSPDVAGGPEEMLGFAPDGHFAHIHVLVPIDEWRYGRSRGNAYGQVHGLAGGEGNVVGIGPGVVAGAHTETYGQGARSDGLGHQDGLVGGRGSLGRGRAGGVIEWHRGDVVLRACDDADCARGGLEVEGQIRSLYGQSRHGIVSEPVFVVIEVTAQRKHDVHLGKAMPQHHRQGAVRGSFIASASGIEGEQIGGIEPSLGALVGRDVKVHAPRELRLGEVVAFEENRRVTYGCSLVLPVQLLVGAPRRAALGHLAEVAVGRIGRAVHLKPELLQVGRGDAGLGGGKAGVHPHRQAAGGRSDILLAGGQDGGSCYQY